MTNIIYKYQFTTTPQGTKKVVRSTNLPECLDTIRETYKAISQQSMAAYEECIQIEYIESILQDSQALILNSKDGILDYNTALKVQSYFAPNTYIPTCPPDTCVKINSDESFNIDPTQPPSKIDILLQPAMTLKLSANQILSQLKEINEAHRANQTNFSLCFLDSRALTEPLILETNNFINNILLPMASYPQNYWKIDMLSISSYYYLTLLTHLQPPTFPPLQRLLKNIKYLCIQTRNSNLKYLEKTIPTIPTPTSPQRHLINIPIILYYTEEEENDINQQRAALLFAKVLLKHSRSSKLLITNSRIVQALPSQVNYIYIKTPAQTEIVSNSKLPLNLYIINQEIKSLNYSSTANQEHILECTTIDQTPDTSPLEFNTLKKPIIINLLTTCTAQQATIADYNSHKIVTIADISDILYILNKHIRYLK